MISMKQEKIIYLDPQKIIPYKKNPRMNENAVKPVAESIKQYGFKVPIIIDKNNIVICGHTRLKAAINLGLDSVPCIIADDLTEDQVKAFRIADNKVSDFSIWDNKLLLEELYDLDSSDLFTGFTFSEIPEIDVLDEKANGPIGENEDGVTYELVCRSESKEKIERIRKMWEDLGGNDE